MTTMASDFFILLLSASVFGSGFFLILEVLYRVKIIGAKSSYALYKLLLLFHMTTPILIGALFAWAATLSYVPKCRGGFAGFHVIQLPISYYFYGYYKELHFLPYAFVLWLAGFAVTFCVRLILSRYSFQHLKRACYANTDDRLEALKHDIEKEYHIRRPVCLCCSELVTSPFLAGIFCPTVFLPDRFPSDALKEQEFPEKYIEFILRHELIHCHKKDIFYKWLLMFVKSFYWCNPVFCLFSKRFQEHCELACDELLLRGCSKDDRLEYAKCILSFVGSAEPGVRLGFYSHNAIEQRIAGIAGMRPEKKKRKRAAVVLHILIVGLFLAATVAAAENATSVRLWLAERMEQIYFTPIS